MSDEPLKVLGLIIDDFIEMQLSDNTKWISGSEIQVEKFEKEKTKIREALPKDGLTYSRGGLISKGGSIATISLDGSVKKHGLLSIPVEKKSAIGMIETDPHAASQYAGNVLEAALTPHSPSKSLILLSGSQYFRYKSWC